MNFPKLTAALAIACVILVGVVTWQAHQLRQLRAGAGDPGTQVTGSHSSFPSSSAAPVNNADANTPAIANHRANPPSPASTSPTNWPKFDWRLVESADYVTYVKNLRAIGCPEQTIRDIVTADVMQAFSARRAQVTAARYAQARFNEFDDEADAQFARQRREVDAMLGDTLHQLLGADAAAPSTTSEWKLAALEQQLAFLPTTKQTAALAVLAQYGDLDVSLPQGISGNRLTATQAEELQARLTRFEQRRDELLRTLTPEEYERMDMTISWTANNLRQAMARFHPTEAEFAAIFREWRAHDVRVSWLWANGEPDPGNQQVFDAITRQLTPERYALYRETWWK
jgi:hypothetical protein